MTSLLEILVDVANLVYVEFKRIHLFQCCKGDKRQFLNVLMTISCSEITQKDICFSNFTITFMNFYACLMIYSSLHNSIQKNGFVNYLHCAAYAISLQVPSSSSCFCLLPGETLKGRSCQESRMITCLICICVYL